MYCGHSKKYHEHVRKLNLQLPRNIVKIWLASISLVVYSCLVYLSTSSTGTSSSMFGCGSAKRLGTSTKAMQRALMKRVVNGSASWEILGSWHESMLRVLPPVCIHFTAQCHDVPSCLYWSWILSLISADPGRRKGERVREKDVLHCY